ncbi:unnamed protein product [Discula destructiva]
MKLFTAAAALFATTALAATTPAPADAVYSIKGFTARKNDGNTIDTVFFNILATNGGTLDFTCVAYDPKKKAATYEFKSGHVYSCGENSFFSFEYDVDNKELYLWQQVYTNVKIGGKVHTGDLRCKAGDFGGKVCLTKGDASLSIVLTTQ